MGTCDMGWNRNTKYVAIDTETTGLNQDDKPFAVSLCDDHGNNKLYLWDIDPLTRQPKVRKRDVLAIKRKCKGKQLVFHNQIFDVEMLERVGCDLDWEGNSYDTGVQSHIINSHTHTKLRGKLKPLSLHYLDMPDDDEQDLRKAVTAARRIGKKLDWNIAPNTGKSKDDHIARDYWLPRAICKYAQKLDEKSVSIDAEQEWWFEYSDPDHPWLTILDTYANGDTERTMLLHLLFQRVMDKWDKDDPRHAILERERRLTSTLTRMRQHPLPISSQKIRKGRTKHGKIVSSSVSKLREVACDDEFNIESPPQLRDVLFDQLKFPVFYETPTKEASTSKQAREEINDWFLNQPKNRSSLYRNRKKFLTNWNTYKDSSKCLSDFERFDRIRNGEFIHAGLNQVGSETTRFSSPLHALKKKGEDQGKKVEGVRDIFGPHDGRIWFCIDFSQLQLRIFAYVAEERNLIDKFEQGIDAHTATAMELYQKPADEITSLERRRAKNVNFGFIFGASPAKIEATAGVFGLWDHVVRSFPSAHAYMQRIKSEVYRNGYVTTPHGYRLYVDQPHKGVNYIVQGCEGDIVKEAMNNCDEYLESRTTFDGHMLFQLHDELLFDFPKPNDAIDRVRTKKHLNKIVYLMEKPGRDIGMKTPVNVEITETDWSETKEYDLAS
jgi:DNA polymerase I-like protein with 3'-5' exonuclease and polymerase domains